MSSIKMYLTRRRKNPDAPMNFQFSKGTIPEGKDNTVVLQEDVSKPGKDRIRIQSRTNIPRPTLKQNKTQPCKLCKETSSQLLNMKLKCTEIEQTNQKLLYEIEEYRQNIHQTNDIVHKLTQANKHLQDDVEMMQILIYRLNVQLERYQDILRNESDIIDIETINPLKKSFGESNPKYWGNINTHVLAPLLHAYHQSIKEKSMLIHNYEQDISKFTGEMKKVITENSENLKVIDNMRLKCDTWITEKTRLTAQMDIFRNKAEIHSKRADLAKEKLIEVLRCYEQKLQAQNIDIERLQDAYSRTNVELTTLRNIQQSPEAVVESLKQCQKLFEELKKEHDAEKFKYMTNVEQLRKQIEEETSKNIKYESQIRGFKLLVDRQKLANEFLSEKNVNLRQDLEKSRRSRELIKSEWNKSIEAASRQGISNSCKQIKHLETLLSEKEMEICNCMTDVEKLKDKLRERDEMLKKILQDKITKKK